MRPVEQRWLADQARAAEAENEMHRLRYVYFMNRLVEALSLPDADQHELTSEIRECARLCRAERAAYLKTTEIESDREHGTVLSVALGRVHRVVVLG